MINGLKAIAPRSVKAAARWASGQLPFPRKPAILMYHRIGHESFDPWGLAIGEHRFEEQLDWLANNRTVISLSEFARQHGEGRLTSDAVSITFDDGYAGTLKAAIPLLEKYGLEATVFLPVELIERRREFWWDELAGIVMAFRGDTMRVGGADIAIPPSDERDFLWPPSAAPATARQKLFQRMRSKLRTGQSHEIEAAMAELRARVRRQPAEANRPLSAGDLRLLSSQTVEFGSHSLTHARLPALNQREQAREIRESRLRCASLTGATPTSFAFPYGEYDRASMRLVQEAGFTCAVTSDHGFVGRRSNLFALPRIRVGSGSRLSMRAIYSKSRK